MPTSNNHPGKRWYDKDPAMSMAISLLNNASYDQQRQAAEHVLGLIEHVTIEETGCQPLQTKQFLQVAHLFPSHRRSHLEPTANRMVEVLKSLPTEIQLEMSLNIINQIYMLEANVPLASVSHAKAASRL